MFPGQRAAIAVHQLSGFTHELAIVRETLLRVEIEIDAAVGHAIAEVPVERRGIAVLGEEPFEVAQICSELVRRHGAVFPAGPMLRLPTDECGCTERCFARLPDPRLLVRVGDDADAGTGFRLLDHAPDL